MEIFINKFWKWLITSFLFAILIRLVYKTPAPFDFFSGVWGAGDILTYISTILLTWVAFYQNRQLKIESDKYQTSQNKLINETNQKFLEIQTNIDKQTSILANIESEKMIPYFRIGTGLTSSGQGRSLKISIKNNELPEFIAHLKNIGMNGISNIKCNSLLINNIKHDVQSTPSIFGIDINEICFIKFPHLYEETQIIVFNFTVSNIIGNCFKVSYKLSIKDGLSLIGEIVLIERIYETL